MVLVGIHSQNSEWMTRPCVWEPLTATIFSNCDNWCRVKIPGPAITQRGGGRAAGAGTCVFCSTILFVAYLNELLSFQSLTIHPISKLHTPINTLKPAMDALNLVKFSTNHLRFKPCKAGWMYPSWSINQLGYNKPVGFYIQLLLATVIAASNNHSVLPAGMASPAGRTQWLHGREQSVLMGESGYLVGCRK